MIFKTSRVWLILQFGILRHGISCASAEETLPCPHCFHHHLCVHLLLRHGIGKIPQVANLLLTSQGDGITYSNILIKEIHKHAPDTLTQVHRQVYWARYVDWTVTTPLLLLDLAFLAGLNGADMLVAVVADLIMVIVGLFAAISDSETNSWGYYTIACVAYLVIIFELAVQGRSLAMAKDSKTGTFFNAIAGFTLILWTLYPMSVFLFSR